MKIVEYAICWIWPHLSNREKEGFLLISSKVQKPVWKEENVVVMKLSLRKSKKSNLSNKHEQEQ